MININSSLQQKGKKRGKKRKRGEREKKRRKGEKEGKKERKEEKKRKEGEGGENPKTYTRDPACDEELSRAEREKIPRAAGSC